MDLYISSLLLGALGLVAMALGGLGHAGHSHGGHGSHGHAGHGHGGHAGHHSHGHHAGSHNGSFIWALMSPRVLFSFALGFGAAGKLLPGFAGDGVVRFALAVLGGVIVERLVVAPLWNLSMRFESAPAATLESAVADEATAVTSFNADGEGIVSVEVDGQIVQLLAALGAGDRDLGVRVRAGQRLRIEDVNAKANRCTVTLL